MSRQRVLKVAYPMRVDALDKPGGDVEHMRTYIRGCERLALKRGFTFHGEILAQLDPELSDFDVVHLTNIDRPVDLYVQFLASRRAVKPTVLTPLHHSYREIERYERKGRGGVIGKMSGLVGFYRLEAMRTLVRSHRYPQLWPALRQTLRAGLNKAQREVLSGCDRVLVITDKEAVDIAEEISEILPERLLKLYNSFNETATSASNRDIEIAVISRLESRKNQIAILEALEMLGLKATFVGPPNPNHGGYCELFRKRIARTSSNYIPGVPPHEVASILSRARVHISASWFEVASLVDLDAYALGCRVVASSCGGTQEMLGNDAYYVDPGSTLDIAEKIAAAVESVRVGTENQLQEFLSRVPTWEASCATLLDLYYRLAGAAAPNARD